MKKLHKILLRLSLLAPIIYSCESNQLEAPIDCELSGPSLTLVDKSNANCGESNGTVELSASGGQGLLVFSSDNLVEESDGVFSGISAGTYSFFVTDEQLCESELIVTIENTDGVSISNVEVVSPGCDNNDGQLEIIAEGGSEPYSYKLDDGAFQAGSTFADLSTGSYTVQVQDDAGCEFSQEVEVVIGISLSTHISPIISTNCAISGGCHNGSQSPDLRENAGIISSASRIKARTSNMSMPLGRTLSQTQIDQIACWVDNGAPNN